MGDPVGHLAALGRQDDGTVGGVGAAVVVYFRLNGLYPSPAFETPILTRGTLTRA